MVLNVPASVSSCIEVISSEQHRDSTALCASQTSRHDLVSAHLQPVSSPASDVRTPCVCSFFACPVNSQQSLDSLYFRAPAKYKLFCRHSCQISYDELWCCRIMCHRKASQIGLHPTPTALWQLWTSACPLRAAPAQTLPPPQPPRQLSALPPKPCRRTLKGWRPTAMRLRGTSTVLWALCTGACPHRPAQTPPHHQPPRQMSALPPRARRKALS